ncbi:MAG: hypothetical protein WBJ13_11990 [Sedimentibacter sp.]
MVTYQSCRIRQKKLNKKMVKKEEKNFLTSESEYDKLSKLSQKSSTELRQ